MVKTGAAAEAPAAAASVLISCFLFILYFGFSFDLVLIFAFFFFANTGSTRVHPVLKEIPHQNPSGSSEHQSPSGKTLPKFNPTVLFEIFVRFLAPFLLANVLATLYFVPYLYGGRSPPCKSNTKCTCAM